MIIVAASDRLRVVPEPRNSNKLLYPHVLKIHCVANESITGPIIPLAQLERLSKCIRFHQSRQSLVVSRSQLGNHRIQKHQ